MAGVYDFDKTILAAYNQGQNSGAEMVNMAEKRKQFDALQRLRQSQMNMQSKQLDMQERLFDSGLLAQEQFAEAMNDLQASKKAQSEYNKGVEKERSRVAKLQFWNKDFWRWDTLQSQLGLWAPTAEELYKGKMEREGTPELGIKPETYQTQVTPEMAGQLQLLQLLMRNSSGQVGDSSIQDLLYQVYGGQ